MTRPARVTMSNMAKAIVRAMKGAETTPPEAK
jgi:hypothetical protein